MTFSSFLWASNKINGNLSDWPFGDNIKDSFLSLLYIVEVERLLLLLSTLLISLVF